MICRSNEIICTIELENGKIKQELQGTFFMVKDKWWKAACELEEADILITSKGKDQVVKNISVDHKGYPVTTYNLTVEDNHTFFVGSEKVITHNTFKLKPYNVESEVVEKATKGVSNLKFKAGYDKHLIEVEDIVWKKGKVLLEGII